MTTPHVCLRCRHSLSLIRRTHLPPLKYHRPFTSLTHHKAQSEAKPGAAHIPREDDISNPPREDTSAEPRWSLDSHDPFLERLFSSSTSSKGAPARGARHGPAQRRKSPGRGQPLLAVRVQLAGKEPTEAVLAEGWASVEAFYDDTARKRDKVGGPGGVTRDLLRATVARFITNTTTGIEGKEGLPTPVSATASLTRYGLMREGYWAEETLWPLLRAINTHSQGGASTKEVLTGEMLEVWKLFFSTYGATSGTTAEWTAVLPSAESTAVVRVHFSRSFQTRFFHFLPRFPPSRHAQALALAAVATFDILSQDSLDPHPLALFLARLLPYADLALAAAQPCLSDGRILASWEGDMTPRALALLASTSSPPPDERHNASAPPPDRDPKILGLRDLFLKRLSRAVERRDLPRAERLWLEALSSFPPPSPPLPLLNRFLQAFMALRRPAQAIGVWNTLVSSGQVPSQASWHALLDGCRTARDGDAIEAVWHRMVSESGLVPDAACWTARISGLVGAGRAEAGLRALHAMGAAHKTSPTTAPRPTTEIVNASISALLRAARGDACADVLRWASGLSIRPDVVTYNTLLRASVRGERGDETQALLADMESRAIAPDITTVTILLDGLFRSPSSSSSAETSATALLSSLTSAALPPTPHTYGTLISALLQRREANLPAARAVLAHMSAQKMAVSPHIYTILLTHHFSTGDLAGVSALWARIRLEGGVVDHVLWDRFVEGYARAGETGLARQFLERAARKGVVVGWEAASLLVRSLLSQGDRGAAEEVVKLVVQGGEGRGRRGEEGFWAVAEEFGFRRP
ncbi:MAG: hypothetical protein M1832_003741 [Thelocarpon impressellum]|nr:MAG: hypothetical protein M1832_003741 [Thelocarpon impressellum]